MERTTMLRICGSAKNEKTQKTKPLTSLRQLCKRSPVGAPGIEPGTSCTPCKRASRTAPRPVSLSLGSLSREQSGIIAAIGESGNQSGADACADGAVLQAIQHILRQAQFPGAKQVGIDIGQDERSGDNLPAFTGNQLWEDVFYGGDLIRLDAGNPLGCQRLTRQGLTDEQQVFLTHIAQEVGCCHIWKNIGHLDNILDQ